jgi:hypothetical protein
MLYNYSKVPRTHDIHSIISDKMTNAYLVEKQNFSFFFLACIDDAESGDEC